MRFRFWARELLHSFPWWLNLVIRNHNFDLWCDFFYFVFWILLGWRVLQLFCRIFIIASSSLLFFLLCPRGLNLKRGQVEPVWLDLGFWMMKHWNFLAGFQMNQHASFLLSYYFAFDLVRGFFTLSFLSLLEDRLFIWEGNRLADLGWIHLSILW